MIDTTLIIIPQNRKGYQLNTTFLIAGYQNGDIGIFSEQDPRMKMIKKAIRRRLIQLLDNGVDWFVFMGNLGFEYWVLEEVLLLKAEGYDCHLATIFCFANHGQHWNEANQVKLQRFKQVDFVKYCYDQYHYKGQLKDYQDFLLSNSQGLFIFYEPDHPTKLSHLYQKARDLTDYDIVRLTYDELNELIQEDNQEY